MGWTGETWTFKAEGIGSVQATWLGDDVTLAVGVGDNCVVLVPRKGPDDVDPDRLAEAVTALLAGKDLAAEAS